MANGPTRRGFLATLASTSALPLLTAPLLVACSGSGFAPFAAQGGKSAADAALLLPLSGPLAGLGQNMADASELVTASMAPADRPKIYDSGDSAVLPDGAWYAAPAPDLYQQFAADFRAAYGTDAGVIAALGYDAALVAAGLSGVGQLNDKGLRRTAGFTGVLGQFRFTDDRRCIRDLAVLRVSGSETTLIAEIEGS